MPDGERARAVGIPRRALAQTRDSVTGVFREGGKTTGEAPALLMRAAEQALGVPQPSDSSLAWPPRFSGRYKVRKFPVSHFVSSIIFRAC